MNVARFRDAFPRDFDPDASRPDVQLFDAHDDASDSRMSQHERRDPLREFFHKCDMSLRNDQTDAVRNDVVGQHIAHICGNMIEPPDVDIDVEAHALRLFTFVRISADPDG